MSQHKRGQEHANKRVAAVTEGRLKAFRPTASPRLSQTFPQRRWLTTHEQLRLP